MTSRNAGENLIWELFSPFGVIREIYLIRNANGSNKGCTLLISAIAVIEALHNNVVMGKLLPAHWFLNMQTLVLKNGQSKEAAEEVNHFTMPRLLQCMAISMLNKVHL
jgi:hypothetical protein